MLMLNPFDCNQCSRSSSLLLVCTLTVPGFLTSWTNLILAEGESLGLLATSSVTFLIFTHSCLHWWSQNQPLFTNGSKRHFWVVQIYDPHSQICTELLGFSHCTACLSIQWVKQTSSCSQSWPQSYEVCRHNRVNHIMCWTLISESLK